MNIPPLRVLRKVVGAPEAIEAGRQELRDLATLYQKSDPDKAAQYAHLAELEGYVDNDQPRNEALNDTLIAHTAGFVIADPMGNIYTDDDGAEVVFKTAKEADVARSKARVSFSFNVKVDEEE